MSTNEPRFALGADPSRAQPAGGRLPPSSATASRPAGGYPGRPATAGSRVFELTTPLGKDVLLFRQMRGREELSRLSEFDVLALSHESAIVPGDLLGKDVSVKVELSKGGTRHFNGYVTRFSQGAMVGRFYQYRLKLRPWLWFLTRTADCRIFQDKTPPEIIKEVFADHKVAVFDEHLTGTYLKREYCVQYRETDFAFVSRLMEEEGIYYYFEHHADRHVLKLVDSSDAHAPLEGKPRISFYEPGKQVRVDEEFIHAWTFTQDIQPGETATDDYDFTKPKAELDVKSRLIQPHEQAAHEVYDWPGEYREVPDGEHYVRARLDELHTEFDRAEAECNVREIATGRTFGLDNAPRGDQQRDYLIVSATYDMRDNAYESSAEEPVTYRCGFGALQCQQQFRPARITPRPVVKGTQTAMVVGPDGEEIYCDKYGRIKVLFHWDRYGKGDENSSCWIRVAQNLSGKRWGMVFIPRIGQEVIVDFLEGDPDRPIVIGAVYNGLEMPPYPLAEHKTKTVIFKSNSSLGGNGFNEIRIEDKKGEEQVFIHGEKDLDVRIKNDRREWIGRDRHLVVKRDKVEEVNRDEHMVVKRDLVEHVKRNHDLTVTAQQSISVGGAHSFKVTGDVSEDFKMNHQEKVNLTYSVTGMQVVIEGLVGITLKSGASFITINPAGIQIMGLPMVMINSGGAPLVAMPVMAMGPGAPLVAEIADNAEPGSMDESYRRQREALSEEARKSKDAPWHDPESPDAKKKPHWIEIELIDQQGKPVPGEHYRITLPDGTTLAEGRLDDKGRARVDGIDPGTCKVTFPELDRTTWRPA
jgi:type VI secretion system secreted protein VgrG